MCKAAGGRCLICINRRTVKKQAERVALGSTKRCRGTSLRVTTVKKIAKAIFRFTYSDDNQKIIAGILGGTYWGRSMNLASHFVDEPKKSSAFFLTVLRL